MEKKTGLNDMNSTATTGVGAESAAGIDSTEKTSLTDKLGDAIEKVGHLISDAGAPGLGQKVHDLGDRLEKGHENPKHPHEV